MKKLHLALLIVSNAWAVSTADLKQRFKDEPGLIVKAGQGLYNQSGANSCLYCHGTAEQPGKVATAAKLHLPKTWKIYKILGGDKAYAQDKAGFLAKLEAATTHLILKGAVTHNVSYKEPWFKLGAAYDSQMLGIGGAPSKAWIKKYAYRGMTTDLAAEAAFAYLKTLDTQNVLTGRPR